VRPSPIPIVRSFEIVFFTSVFICGNPAFLSKEVSGHDKKSFYSCLTLLDLHCFLMRYSTFLYFFVLSFL